MANILNCSKWPSSIDPKIQSATLLYVIGPAALEVYNMFTWANDDDKQKVEIILQSLLYPASKRHLGDTCFIHTINVMMKL